MNTYRVYIEEYTPPRVYIYQVKDNRVCAIYSSIYNKLIDPKWNEAASVSVEAIYTVEAWNKSLKHRRGFEARAENIEELIKDNLVEFL